MPAKHLRLDFKLTSKRLEAACPVDHEEIVAFRFTGGFVIGYALVRRSSSAIFKCEVDESVG